MGHGEVGGYTQRLQTAWPCLGSGLESPVWDVSLLLCMIGLKNSSLNTVYRAFISSIEGFCSLEGWLLAESTDYRELVNEWVRLES